jgi:hypothetical protein
MSDTTDAPEVEDQEVDSPEETERPDGAPEADQFDEDRAKAAITKKNQENASLRKRLKELEPLAAKAKELQDASKTETEKLTERLTASEQRAQEAELRALRLEVAADKGLTPAQARRLVGASKEELEADADDLLATFGAKDKPTGKVASRPREKLRGGGDPDEPVEETDPKKLAASIPRR